MDRYYSSKYGIYNIIATRSLSYFGEPESELSFQTRVVFILIELWQTFQNDSFQNDLTTCCDKFALLCEKIWNLQDYYNTDLIRFRSGWSRVVITNMGGFYAGRVMRNFPKWPVPKGPESKRVQIEAEIQPFETP